MRGDAQALPLRAECAHLVLADPPYSEYVHRSTRRSGRLGPQHMPMNFCHLTETVRNGAAKEMARIAKRWVLVFSDLETAHLWREALCDSGLEYIRTGIWHKFDYVPQFTGDRPANACEAILLCHRAGVRKRWNGRGRQAFWSEGVAKDRHRNGRDRRTHPAQKPEALISHLIHLFSEPGDLVVDPFLGSGTTGVVARRAGRRWVGVELSEQSVELAIRNTAQHALFRFGRNIR